MLNSMDVILDFVTASCPVDYNLDIYEWTICLCYKSSHSCVTVFSHSCKFCIPVTNNTGHQQELITEELSD